MVYYGPYIELNLNIFFYHKTGTYVRVAANTGLASFSLHILAYLSKSFICWVFQRYRINIMTRNYDNS